MTGNQDRTAAGADWHTAVTARLRPLVERSVAALEDTTLEKGKSLEVQRYSRAIELTARCADRVEKMTHLAPPKRKTETCEDKLSEHDRDDSPENLERIRNELERSLSVVEAGFEKKGLVMRPGRWPAPRTGGEVLRSA